MTGVACFGGFSSRILGEWLCVWRDYPIDWLWIGVGNQTAMLKYLNSSPYLVNYPACSVWLQLCGHLFIGRNPNWSFFKLIVSAIYERETNRDFRRLNPTYRTMLSCVGFGGQWWQYCVFAPLIDWFISGCNTFKFSFSGSSDRRYWLPYVTRHVTEGAGQEVCTFLCVGKYGWKWTGQYSYCFILGRIVGISYNFGNADCVLSPCTFSMCFGVAGTWVDCLRYCDCLSSLVL